MKDLISAIVNIFRYTGKFFTILRNTFFNLLFLLFIGIVVFSFLPTGDKTEGKPKQNSILSLDISGNIVEERKILSSIEKLFEDPFLGQSQQQETLLQDLLDVIEASTTDDQIQAIVLNLKHMDKAGLNQLERIGEALNKFKKSGKEIVATEDYYTQAQYFLASFASSIIINPMGGVDIHGIGVYRLYFKDAIDKLKINYNIFKVGTYKSALEPFTRTGMSEQDQLQNEAWLAKLWQGYSNIVTENRKINSFQLRRYTNNIAEELSKVQGNTAQLALNMGLVDHIMTRTQVKEYLSALCNCKNSSPPITSTQKYLETVSPSYTPDGSGQQGIGVIVAEGNILPGKQPTGFIGADSLSALIDKAREDSTIKALVLRINSGGGSAFASEVIRQSLLEYKKTNKPLVVSMGTVAASGGYWIAADADEIWAESSTITGSIGIFGAIPTFENTLDSLGIYSDGIGTTPVASGLNLTRPLAQPIKDSIQQNIEYNYGQFLDIVSSGRGIERQDVEKIAEGRVYDGISAADIGLVDSIGSLTDGIKAAGRLAGLSDDKARYIQPPASVKEQLLQYFSASVKSLPVIIESHWFREIQKILTLQLPPALSLEDPFGVYAICEIKPFLN
ncbi:signal peptide peptidase SppA [Desulforhopalus sp. IMCC35007]|uniref:signal peptide peptidase SppA n=1 Tax=Desulforhopalus sp. IMCC35007 TaxID=2569543 RepID=UPI0010ADB16D|nr:signal peptide peptidase SppA [Desulforhopalus sp. IMCC35007]TKB10323.1 signal peptide peptidase SppA [Desulforhopalus sp. IMCC35007]